MSNADVGKTIAQILGLNVPNHGSLVGRVIREAMPRARAPRVLSHIEKSSPSDGGLRTILKTQRVGATRYFDAAGFPGRTVGLESGETASR